MKLGFESPYGRMERHERIIRAAGIIDGEGSIYQKKGYYPVVTAEMTDEDVIEELHDLFGGSISTSKGRREGYKQTYRLTVQGQKAIDLLEVCLPYFFSRRKQRAVEVMNEFYKHMAH